jgi:hypothetical protein
MEAGVYKRYIMDPVRDEVDLVFRDVIDIASLCESVRS